MRHRVFRVAFAAVWLQAAVVPFPAPVFAQNTDAKPTEQAQPGNQEPAKDSQKVDEFVEAQKALGGPAGNPECVWFGRRVLTRLWNDDLDTAFRHLDLYDRFGCPSGHVQASFRCLLLHAGSINPKATDPKAPDSLTVRVQSCWLNPTQPVTPPPAAAAPPAAPAPAAAAPSPTTNR
jgi:hypothetical protein